MTSERRPGRLSSTSKGKPTYVTLRDRWEKWLVLSGRGEDTLRVIAKSGMRERSQWDGTDILRIEFNVTFPTIHKVIQVFIFGGHEVVRTGCSV